VTLLVDLDDLFGVTTEGRGGYDANPNGRVTTWIDLNGSLLSGGIGEGYNPIGILATHFDNPMQADARDRISFSWGSATLGKYLNIDTPDINPDGSQDDSFNISLGNKIGASFDLIKLSANVGRFEFDKDGFTNAYDAIFSENQSAPIASRLVEALKVLGSAFSEFTPGDGISGTGCSETLKGTNNDDLIDGGGGIDTIYGYNGNDKLDGGGDNDILYGGMDNDTYVYCRDDGSDIINEQSAGSACDILEIWDNSSLIDLDNFNDLRFMKSGNDLIISLDIQGALGTSDYNSGQVTILNQGTVSSKVEILRLYDDDGKQIKGDIDLGSVYNAASEKLSTLYFSDHDVPGLYKASSNCPPISSDHL
jgi:Ca2+-binding RTX toxin-like protein